MMILSIVATVVLLGALFYHRINLLLSSVILLAWTAALGVAGLWNIWLLLPLAIILLPFNFAPMRKSIFSAPAFRAFRKVMPPMSRTEKEPSTRARPGGKATCFAARRTGRNCTTIRSRA
jgi:acyl-CoA dehydrogenase